MNKNSLNSNEKKKNINPQNKNKLFKNNTINYFNTTNGKLNIDSSAYLKLTKENQNFKKNIKIIKRNNISSIDKKINNNTSIDKNNKIDNKESILFKKFIEFRNKYIRQKLKNSKNKSKNKSKKKLLTPKTQRVKKTNKNNLNLSSLKSTNKKDNIEDNKNDNKNDIIKTTEIKDNKFKTTENKINENDNKKNENKNKEKIKKSKSDQILVKTSKYDDKEYQNLKNSSYSKFNKKKSTNFVNKIDIFNKIINSNTIKKNPVKFQRSQSCQILKSNTENDIIKYNKKNKNKKEGEKDNELIEENKLHNQTLDLKSKEYSQNIKSDKNQYYNNKNNIYIIERRQRIEEKLNEILFEKYKVVRPLRMTKRKFFIENKSKKNKNKLFDQKIYNKRNFNNRMNINLNNILRNNYNNSWNNIMNSSKENNEKNNKDYKNKNIIKIRNNDDKDFKNNPYYSQSINYNNTINNIIKMRKFLTIEEYFNEIRREYNLLDFNFSFLLENLKNK